MEGEAWLKAEKRGQGGPGKRVDVMLVKALAGTDCTVKGWWMTADCSRGLFKHCCKKSALKAKLKQELDRNGVFHPITVSKKCQNSLEKYW